MNPSHQNHHSRTGLTNHLFCAYNTFSYLYVSSFSFLNMTKKNLTNQMEVYVTAGRIVIASAYGRDVYDSALEKTFVKSDIV